MTRLRMAFDAIAALIDAATTTPARRAADNRRNHLLLADRLVAAEHARTNGDKP